MAASRNDAPARRRRWAWPTVAGAAFATVALTAAVGLPQILGASDDGTEAGGAGAPSVSPSAAPSVAPAATFAVPADPFTFTFSGYRAGRLKVHDPSVVSTAYEIARITDGNDLYAYLTLFRPGAFDPESLVGAERTTVAGRPALQRSEAADPGEAGAVIKRLLAWQYADDRWATVQSYSDAENDPSPRDLRTVAEALRPGAARPARVPFTMSYAPAGYRPLQVGSEAWASLSGIASDPGEGHGGVLFVKSPPKPAGLVGPWDTDADSGWPNWFEILVSPDPRRARPTAPACADYFCYTWRAGGTVKIEVVSLRLSDAEMKKILLGVKIVSIGDKDKRTVARSAFPVRP